MQVSRLKFLFTALALNVLFHNHEAHAQWSLSDPFGGWYVTSSAVLGSKVFVSTSNGKMYTSIDNGVNWINNTGLASQSVVALSTVGTSIFAGTSAGGVFRSDDNGATWNAFNNGLSNTFVKSLITVGTNIYVSLDWCFLCSDGGVFLSTDKGATWTTANNGIGTHSVSSFASIGTNLFAGSSGVGVFRSSDNGTSWTAVNSGLNLSVICLLANGTSLLAGTIQGAFVSTNNGDSWTAINNGLMDMYSPTLNVSSLALSGNYLFAGTFDGLFLSTDNGNSWGILTPGNVASRYMFINQGKVFASVTDFSIMGNEFYTQPLNSFPRITSIKPAAGIIGSTVTLKGSGFSTTPSANTIQFSTVSTKAKTSSGDSLTFVVPTSATTGSISIQVNGENSSSVRFTIVPAISYFNPTSGPVGSTMTIVGSGYSNFAANDTVTFGGIVAKVSNAVDFGVTVVVPPGLSAGPTPLNTRVGGQTDPGKNSFIILPGVTSFTPISGAAGSTVTITGTSFDPKASNNTVTFGGAAATVTSATTTSLTVTVPTKAVTGHISVTVNGQTGSSSNNFTVLPKVLSFDPAFGVTGTTVTIKGTGFDSVASKNKVAFGLMAATVKSATSTSITALVPATAATGFISVTTNDNTANSTKAFRVDPTITSFSPSAGYPGTYAIVSGTGFNSHSTVAVNGVICFTSSVTSQSINFFVAESATTGPVTVSQDSATATSATNFTVLIVPVPVALAPTNITTDGFTANWKSVSVASAYLLDISSDNFNSYVVGYKAKLLTDTSAVVTGLKTGFAYEYRVRTVDKQGHSSANSNVISSVFTGDIIVSSDNGIYPNPASNTIYLASSESSLVTARVIDATGKYDELDFHQTGNLVEINISNLVSGIYVLQVIDGGKPRQYKLMKL